MTFDASYVALCRELRLERKPFEYGDVWCFWKDVSTGPFIQGASGNEGADEFAIWLPRLDQWLSMLEEAGTSGVLFTKADSRWEAGAVIYRDPWRSELGATREEAIARLWCAVTGRVVTA